MDKKMIVLIGAAVTIVGLFLPIVNLPIVGSINLLMPPTGIGDGIFVLIFAVIAGVLALLGHVKHAVWPAICAIGFTAFKFFQLKGPMDEAAERVAALTAGNPQAAEYLNQMGGGASMNMLGWLVIIVGCIVMLVGGAMAWKSAPPSAAA